MVWAVWRMLGVGGRAAVEVGLGVVGVGEVDSCQCIIGLKKSTNCINGDMPVRVWEGAVYAKI